MDEDLGTQTGDFVSFGTNLGTNDFTLSCNFGASDDAVLMWTAPSAGMFEFDTSESNFDTVLAAFTPACPGLELACNDDDFALAPQSLITLDLAADETVLIVIEGFAGGFGDYLLDITPV